MMIESRTSAPYESPYAHKGIRAENVTTWYRSANGRLNVDVSVHAYDTLDSDRLVDVASHPACLWPRVGRYLSEHGRY